MSALGHKQTLPDVRRTSALPPKPDIVSAKNDVCFVPKADIVVLPREVHSEGKEAVLEGGA
jgi:hypothetical protein